MLDKLQRKFALSRQGAKDLISACLVCFINNIALMLPVGLIYRLSADFLTGAEINIPFYIAGALILLALIFALYYVQYNATFFATYVETGVRRVTLAEKIRKIPLSFFGKKDLSDLTSTMMSDCTTLETAFSHYIPELAGAVMSTALVSVCLFAINVKMAIAAVWVVPLSFADVFFSAKVQDCFNKKVTAAKLGLAEGIQECLEALKDIKSCNGEEKYLAGLDRKIINLEHKKIFSELATAVFVVSGQLILKLGIATTALAGSLLLIKGEIDLLVFFMFLLVASRLYDPLQGSLINLAAIIATRTPIERMNEILFHPIQEGQAVLSNNGCDIAFQNVSFSYNSGEEVLKDVTFTAKQGEITALVGPSGGGKTTATRLAARFWDVSGGKITLGGMDISKTDPETLLSLYSIVFQDVTLFNNTVMENIRIGRRGATDAEVKKAAELAECTEFIEKLESGFDTLIGENGCKLSGGERQRISIARAFLKNAPIILLDEATASLDAENETLIRTAISRLVKDKTVIMIAHRMRTIMNADKIVVLQNGTISEQGTADELIKAKGAFYNMINKQA